MLVGTGIDIVEIERIAKSIERYGDRFLEKILLPGVPTVAQEELLRAMPLGLRRKGGGQSAGYRHSARRCWKELEVQRLPGHRPHLTGRAQEFANRPA